MRDRRDEAWPGDEAEPVGEPIPEEGPREGPWIVRAVTLLVVAVAGSFAALLAVGAILPRVAAEVGGSVEASVVLPDDTEMPDLRERSVVYAADGTLLSILHDEEDRRVVPLDALPDHVWQAVLTAEDRRFFEHEGYDVEGLARAALANLRARDITQGGSTLTQQLAKMNFLDAAQTLDRKFTELLYAMALEKEHDKDELLERYLNQVYFGSGAYGVQAAAEEYFGVGAAELSPQESALLAGVIRAPSSTNPRRDAEIAERRRDLVLAGMADEGYLTAQEASDLQATEVEVIEEGDQEVKEPYVVEAAKQQFLADPTFGATFEERRERLFGGGLEIHTTIDPALQEMARDVVAERFGGDGPTAGIASVDHTTGAVRAIYSGADFEAEQFDLARQGRRSPGSAFKTFAMIEALEQGYPPSLSLDGSSPVEIVYDGGDQTWEPTNYGGASYGTIDLGEATTRSVNTYYAQLMTLVGVEEVVERTELLGVDRQAAYRGEEFPSIVLGGLEGGVSPLEMASAYGAIANLGTHIDAHFIDRVIEDDEAIYEADPDEREALSPAVASASIDLLTDVVSSGTGTSASVDGWHIAGKTGTTNDNTDAWFVGVSPVLSTAVWVGHPERQVSMPGATGGGTAAPVWSAFMRQALAEFEPSDFPEADDADLESLYAGEEVEVPDVVGLTEAEATLTLAEARLGVEVVNVASFAPAGVVAWQQPGGGSDHPIGTPVRLGVSTGQPPAPEPEPEPEPDDGGGDDGGGDGGGSSGNGGNGDGNGGGDADGGDGSSAEGAAAEGQDG